MNNRQFAMAMGASVIAVLAGLWIALSAPGDDAADAASASAVPADASRTASRAPAPRMAASAPTTFEDAARLLELGVAGDLNVDMHTRSALDILLASIDAESGEAGLQRLDEALRRTMPDEAATQAMALVRRYEAYRRADTALSAAAAPSSPEAARELLERTHALRRQHFDDTTARALFGVEEELTRIDLEIHAVDTNPALTPQEKAAQIAALRERVPRDLPGLQSPEPVAHQAMEREIAALREQGAPQSQIDALRARHLGSEAAQALGEMEAQRAQWEARYQAYLQQKKGIVAAAPSDMAAQLDAALREHFKEEELEAARAYDRSRTP